MPIGKGGKFAKDNGRSARFGRDGWQSATLMGRGFAYNIRMPPVRSAFLSVTPLIPTGGSLADALKFYKDQLGFSIIWEAGAGAGIARDSVSFVLVQNDNREWADNASFSVGVADLDALFEEFRHAPGARVGPLETKSWGRREFHMVVPSGVCLQFYQQAG